MTLHRHIQSIQDFNKTKQKLSEIRETMLVRFILGFAACGFPPTHTSIEKYTNVLIQHALPDQAQDLYDPVGKGWIYAFLDRHHNHLQSHWSKPLDMQLVFPGPVFSGFFAILSNFEAREKSFEFLHEIGQKNTQKKSVFFWLKPISFVFFLPYFMGELKGFFSSFKFT